MRSAWSRAPGRSPCVHSTLPDTDGARTQMTNSTLGDERSKQLISALFGLMHAPLVCRLRSRPLSARSITGFRLVSELTCEPRTPDWRALHRFALHPSRALDIWQICFVW